MGRSYNVAGAGTQSSTLTAPTPSETPSSEKAKQTERSKSTEVERLPFLPGTGVPPADRLNIVWFIFLLHGIGTLMPWNMFITVAHNYYEKFKFMQAIPHSIVMDGTLVNETVLSPTNESRVFMHYMTICSQTPNLLLNLLNIFVPVKGALTRRIVISISIVGLIVAATDIFVYIDTSAWIGGFFILTLLSVAILNGANGVYQNSIYGLVSDFPFKYTNAVIIGNNFCGTFITVLNILAVLVTKDAQMQAFLFFSISFVTIVLCFTSFFALKTQEFFQYYTELGETNRNAELTGRYTTGDYLGTIRQGKEQFINVFLIFFVTLSLFPNVMANVWPNPLAPGSNSSAINANYDFVLPRDQYTNLMCFMLFNVLAFIGSMAASAWKPLLTPRMLSIATWLRLLLIPAIVMCNYLPRGSDGMTRTIPVWFSSPWIYLLFAVLMSLSSGYFSSLAMMYAPRVVDPSHSRLAGMISAFVLILGIVCGLWFSVALAKIVML